MPCIVVVGAQAAGKTTLLERAKKFGGFEVINIGDIILKLAIKREYVKNRDELRYFDIKNRKTYMELQRLAYAEVGKMTGNVVIDTHAIIKAGNRYIPGMPYEYVKLLKDLIGFVYVDSEVEEILKRRKRDKVRKREIEDPLEITAKEEMDMGVLASYALSLNVPIYFIHNKEGKLEDAVQEFQVYLSELFGV